jgi:hypothetical protein
MHLRALSLLLTASGLVTLPLAGCGGDTSMTDAGPRDASAAGCGVNNGGCSTTPMVTCSTDADGDAVCGPCPTGYSGDGRVCTSSMPVNECALGTDNCAPQATCTDTAAAFTCACSAGYMGDGVSCTRIGCTDATDCDDGVSCTNDTCGDSGNCIHTPVPALCPVGSSCNLATGCMAGRICGSQDDCVDTDPCTRNETCNPVSATCTFTVLDNDMDGEPPLVCGGTDCNDADEDVGARVPEYCGNLVDDDCNGVVDTDATVDTDVALRNDESNCGSCGNQCDGDETCYQGACVACGGGGRSRLLQHVLLCGQRVHRRLLRPRDGLRDHRRRCRVRRLWGARSALLQRYVVRGGWRVLERHVHRVRRRGPAVLRRRELWRGQHVQQRVVCAVRRNRADLLRWERVQRRRHVWWQRVVSGVRRQWRILLRGCRGLRWRTGV